MKLQDIEVLPGCVIDINDPLKIGRVKCDVPTVFDSSVMNTAGMPWICPFTQAGFQKFSTPIVGQKVWVMKSADNYREFWYLPMPEQMSDTRDMITTGDNYETSEILISRNLGANSVHVHYTESDGIMLSIGENEKINIGNDGKIDILSYGTGLTIKNGIVYIGDGTDNNAEFAAKGETIVSMLTAITKELYKMSSACTTTPFTAALATNILNLTDIIETYKKGIPCSKTKVN